MRRQGGSSPALFVVSVLICALGLVIVLISIGSSAAVLVSIFSALTLAPYALLLPRVPKAVTVFGDLRVPSTRAPPSL